MKIAFYHMISLFIIGISLFFPSIAMTEDKESPAFFGNIGNSTLDRNANSSGGAVQITAANEGSSASLRFGRTISRLNDKIGNFSTWNLLFSAPLDKDEDTTEVATLDGLNKAFTAKFVFNTFHWPGLPEDEKLRNQELYDKICEEAKRGYLEDGKKEEDWDCDSNMVKVYANHRYAEFRPLVIKQADPSKPNTWRTLWGFSGTIGYEKFDYRDPITLDEDDTSKAPWAAGAHVGFIPPIKNYQILVSLGYDYQESFRKHPDSVKCPVDTGASVVSCVSGSFGEPDRRRKHLGYIEIRGLVAGFGTSLKYTYDFENYVNGLDMPIYLFRNKSNNLNAGLRFGWNDDNEDVQAGVFVGSEFKFFD